MRASPQKLFEYKCILLQILGWLNNITFLTQHNSEHKDHYIIHRLPTNGHIHVTYENPIDLVSFKYSYWRYKYAQSYYHSNKNGYPMDQLGTLWNVVPPLAIFVTIKYICLTGVYMYMHVMCEVCINFVICCSRFRPNARFITCIKKYFHMN